LRYFFHIGFVGTNYVGWQKLPGIVSVQQTIENVFGEILKQPVSIVGCGRTDAHVHAGQYFFHADLENAWDFDLKYRVNSRLPSDIALFDIIPMEGLPHARFDAIQRQYDYFFHTYKDPFLSGRSSMYLIDGLDLDKMQQAVELLARYDDYYAFCKCPTRNEHTICHVSAAQLYVNDKKDRFWFHISSNRFLRGMIRIIVAKLLEIGQGTLSVDEFESLLCGREAAINVTLASPQGLYLSKITYPYLDLPVRSTFSFHPTSSEINYWRKV
jgi:tRNA pseudouridine38-40 synthase